MAGAPIVELPSPITQTRAQRFSDSSSANSAGTVVDYLSADHHSGDLHVDFPESRRPVY